MAEEKNFKITSSKLGTIYIADEVLAISAGLAAIEVDGVASMSGGVVEGMAQKLGRKNLTSGVKVDMTEEEAVIDIYIIIKYGSIVSKVSKAIQEKVKKVVEETIGLKVTAVNVHVQGLSLAKEEEETEEEK